MTKDLVTISTKLLTRLQHIEVEAMGLREEIAELKKQIHDLKYGEDYIDARLQERTECPNCDGFVGPRGCMDCNDPTGEFARADEQAEHLKEMKNW